MGQPWAAWHPRRLARWHVAFVVLAAILPWVTAFGPAGFIESDAARAPAGPELLRQIAARSEPEVRARAAILVDGATGAALWQREPDRQLPMASTTKIMTALLATERGRLDQRIPVTRGAGDFAGQSVAGLRAGEELSLREMLYALLLPSGNEAANALASALGGSVEGWVGLMNQRAVALGLRNTHYANPEGLDAPNHFTSARDLARLTRVALEVPIVAEVVSTREHDARGQWVYHWTNTNLLLARRPDVTGVKTGTTDAAGETLVLSGRRGDRRAIVVLLNSPDRWSEGSALLDYYFAAFAQIRPTLPRSPFYRDLAVPAGDPETVPIWQTALVSASVRPVDAGESTRAYELIVQLGERVLYKRAFTQ